MGGPRSPGRKKHHHREHEGYRLVCRYCGKWVNCRRMGADGRGTYCNQHKANYINEQARITKARARDRKKVAEAERRAASPS